MASGQRPQRRPAPKAECPHCSTQFKVIDTEKAGQMVSCPECETPFRLKPRRASRPKPVTPDFDDDRDDFSRSMPKKNPPSGVPVWIWIVCGVGALGMMMTVGACLLLPAIQVARDKAQEIVQKDEQRQKELREQAQRELDDQKMANKPAQQPNTRPNPQSGIHPSNRPSQPRPIQKSRLEQAIEKLESDNSVTRGWGVRDLSNLDPDPKNEAQRKRIAAILEKELDSDDIGIRSAAAKALAKWGGPENVPAMIGQLSHEHTFFRRDLMDALVAIGDERAIDPIAERLVEFFDRRSATKALVTFGEKAHPAVVRRLQHSDRGVAKAACQVLAQTGTGRHIVILEQLAAENRHLKRDAEKAIEKIRSRTS